MFSRSSATVLASHLRARGACSAGALRTQKRNLEYWGVGVTGRTQPYAQGDVLPRADNTRFPVNKPSSAAAALTGNPLGIAYDTDNIFNVEGYSQMEKEHYVPFRGLDKHKREPISDAQGPVAANIIREMLEPDVELSLTEAWWNTVLRDFPALKKPCTPAFRKAWQDFYLSTLEVAHKDAEVTALAKPFIREQMQQKFISYAMVWRLAERLADAIGNAPHVSVYERRASRIAIEHVTKLALDTIADEPWAHQDATNPLFVDISNFRAWHEAGNW